MSNNISVRKTIVIAGPYSDKTYKSAIGATNAIASNIANRLTDQFPVKPKRKYLDEQAECDAFNKLYSAQFERLYATANRRLLPVVKRLLK